MVVPVASSLDEATTVLMKQLCNVSYLRQSAAITGGNNNRGLGEDFCGFAMGIIMSLLCMTKPK